LMEEVALALREATELASLREPEEEPFRYKEKAARVLKECAESLRGSAEGERDEAQELLAAAAVLDARQGALLVEMEAWHDGEELLEKAATELGEATTELRLSCFRQEVHNQLGVLWCNRGEHAKALCCLERARAAYEARTEEAERTPVLGGVLEQAPEPPAPTEGKDAEIGRVHDGSLAPVEAHYTQTLFFLAQVQGHLGREDESADACGLCLRRQLEAGVTDVSEWVQNATQLAGFYVDKGQYAMAEALLSAASAVGGEPGTARGDALAAEVRANLQLGHAKFYAARLEHSRTRASLLADDPSPPELELASIRGSEADDLKAREAFPSLTLALSATRIGAEAWLAEAWPGALELFNTAMPLFRRAMEFYVLDGYVTEHCQTLLDVSALHVSLAAFEPDAHRRCVMHKRRLKPLAAVLTELGYNAFPGLWKTMQYEVGQAWRTIAETKMAERRPHAKCAAAGVKAAEAYNAFLSKYHQDAAMAAAAAVGDAPPVPKPPKGDDALPIPSAKLDTEDEAAYLQARFYLATVLHKLQPERGPDTTFGARALKEFEACAAYGDRFGAGEAFQAQMSICKDMAALLPERLAMLALQR